MQLSVLYEMKMSSIPLLVLVCHLILLTVGCQEWHDQSVSFLGPQPGWLKDSAWAFAWEMTTCTEQREMHQKALGSLTQSFIQWVSDCLSDTLEYKNKTVTLPRAPHVWSMAFCVHLLKGKSTSPCFYNTFLRPVVSETTWIRQEHSWHGICWM